MELTREQLDHLRLKQERELKERELDLRERELEQQRKSRTPWSTSVVVALVGGILGDTGTLIPAARTGSWSATRTTHADPPGDQDGRHGRQRNLNTPLPGVPRLQRPQNHAQACQTGRTLHNKAQGAGPSSPVVQGVEFQRSTLLTGDLQAKLQTALASYEVYLVRGEGTKLARDGLRYVSTRRGREQRVLLQRERHHRSHPRRAHPNMRWRNTPCTC